MPRVRQRPRRPPGRPGAAARSRHAPGSRRDQRGADRSRASMDLFELRARAAGRATARRSANASRSPVRGSVIGAPRRPGDPACAAAAPSRSPACRSDRRDGGGDGGDRRRRRRALHRDPSGPDGSRYDEPWFPAIPLDGATTESARIPDRGAGLVLVGHALTHADEPDGLLRAIESALAPGGLVAIEFHHVLGLAQGQFDVLSHAHRSYLSLHSLERLLARHGLAAVTAERVPDYGGTVRVLAGRTLLGTAPRDTSPAVEQIRQTELEHRVQVASGFEALPGQVARGRAELRGYFERTRRDARP